MPLKGNIHSYPYQGQIILLFHIAIVPLCNASPARASAIRLLWYAIVCPAVRFRARTSERPEPRCISTTAWPPYCAAAPTDR